MSGPAINRDVQAKHIPVVINAINKMNRAITNDIDIKSFSFDLKFDDSAVYFNGGGSYFNPYNISVYQQLIDANYEKVVEAIRTIENKASGKLEIPKYDGSGLIEISDTLPENIKEEAKNNILNSITQYILNNIDSTLVNWISILYNDNSPYYNPDTKPTSLKWFNNFRPLLRLHAKANDSSVKEICNIIFNSKTILSMHIHRDRFVDAQGGIVDEYSRRLGFLSSSANNKYPDIYFNFGPSFYVTPAPVTLYNGSCTVPDWYLSVDPCSSNLYPRHQTALLGHTVRCTIYYI